MNIFGTGAGFGADHRDAGTSAAPGDAPQRLGQPTITAGHGASASPGDCHYFLQGTCAKGESCLFRHNPAAKASGVVCRFWQNGFCKDAANCSFQHPASGGRGHGRAGPGGRFASGRGMGGGRGVFGGGRGGSRPPTWETVDRSQQACVFFAQGLCTKGDACPFRHATAPDGGVVQAPLSGNPQQRADVPPEEQSRARIPASVKGTLPQTVADGSGGIDGARTGFSGRHSEVEHASAARQTGPGPSPPQDDSFGTTPFTAAPPVLIGRDGNTYVMGPNGPILLDAVMRTMAADNGSTPPTPTPPTPTPVEQKPRAAIHTRNDQPRATGAMNAPEKAGGQTGIITLPDGGFVTRKRAAELQRLGTTPAEKDLRRVRQRGGQEPHSQPQERRSGMPESRSGMPESRSGLPESRSGMPGSRGAPESRVSPESRGAPPPQPGNRVSVKYRLGPAKNAPVPAPAPMRETVVGPNRSRLEPPCQLARKREEPPQRSAPVDHSRSAPQVAAPSMLARSQARGVARPTRHLDGGGGLQTASTGRGGPSTTRPTPQRTKAVLDFKIPTLGEIKSRKAKAEVEGAKAAPQIIKMKTDAAVENAKAAPQREGAEIMAKELPTSKGSSFEAPHVGWCPPPAAKEERAPEPAPSPAPAVPSNTPQLDAADMDEFSEWL